MAKLEFYKVPENGSDSITFSIRTSTVLNEHLEEIAHQVNLSKNKIVNMMIEYALNNMVIKECKYTRVEEINGSNQRQE